MNTDYIEDETLAIWLRDLFKNEINKVESAAQHRDNAELNRQYAEILRNAYNEIEKSLE